VLSFQRNSNFFWVSGVVGLALAWIFFDSNHPTSASRTAAILLFIAALGLFIWAWFFKVTNLNLSRPEQMLTLTKGKEVLQRVPFSALSGLFLQKIEKGKDSFSFIVSLTGDFPFGEPPGEQRVHDGADEKAAFLIAQQVSDLVRLPITERPTGRQF
jgi:hypothetical protein